MSRRIFAVPIFLAAWGVISPTAASAVTDPDELPDEATKEGPLDLTISIGAAYDDNVAISQIDNVSGVADGMGTLDVSADYRIIETDKTKVSVGYDFSQNVHFKLSAYDLQIHSPTLNASTKLGSTTFGVTYGYNHVRFGGDTLFNMHLVNPSVLFPVTKSIYGRASLLYLNERFKTFTAHNARHWQPEAQLFWFFDKARGHVLVSANYQRETTDGAEFTYKGKAAKAALKLPLSSSETPAKLKAEVEYLARNYDNITPSIGVPRRDRVTTITFGLEIPVQKNISATLEAEHANRTSNLPIADLNQNVVSAGLIFQF